MADSAKSGKLTYERLGRSLERLYDSVLIQLPDLKDAARARDLQQIINDSLYAARLGEERVAVDSPAQLKRELKIRIAEIHAEHDKLDAVAANATTEPAISTGTFAATVANSNINSNVNSNINSNINSPTQTSQSRKRTRRSSQQENPTARAAPQAAGPAVLSAAKKTPIIRRGAPPKSTTSKRANANAAITPPRTAVRIEKRRRHTTPSRRRATPPPWSADQDAEEAAQRAVAMALLKLSEHGGSAPSRTASTAVYQGVSSLPLYVSPPQPLASATRRDRGRKRALADQEEDEEEAAAAAAVVSSPPMRARALPPLPSLHGLTASQAFEAGAQYAVGQLGGGEGVMAWVRERLGGGTGEGRKLGGGVVGRGFWDVV
ncbi:hypothetical protein SVAN01_03982 [Stagonosporopsis vannaccii]|nr:hypothetical protein SVAN01_03982 [Stagonosporopsis vannaccii]